jgi:peptide deformylase
MIREILRMGDPRLLTRAAAVIDPQAPAIRELVADLFDTMRAADGAGLAAPQIGVPLRVVIFGYSAAAPPNPRYPLAELPPETILINPELTLLDDAPEEGWEGCLSVPGMRGLVPRARRLHYRGYDLDGHLVERLVTDFHARVVQHECDHLDGILFPMRIRDLRNFGFTAALFPDLPPEGDD